MDKSNGKDWFAKTLNSVTEESAKAYTISENALQINTLKKSISEKNNIMLEKLINYIDIGRIDKELFEPELSKIKKIESDILTLVNDTADIKSNSKIPFDKVSVLAKDVATESKRIAVKIKDSISDKFKFDGNQKS